jgi:uncharacterized DUF497 family protein
VRFEWNPDKAAANLVKHRVSFELAQAVWDDPLHVIVPDRVDEATGEQRWHAIGMVGAIAILLVVHVYPDPDVAVVKTTLRDVASENGWVKDNKLSRMNGRDVYRDPSTGNLYAVDTQHGRFEMTNSRGTHLGEIDISGMQSDPADRSGNHDLRVN